MNMSSKLQQTDCVGDLTACAVGPRDVSSRTFMDIHDNGVEIVFPPDKRQQVTVTTEYPWNMVGQLIMRFPNGDYYSGTGTLVDKTHVLTAAHNVYGHDFGGEATDVWFVPARNGSVQPYGSVQASKFFFPQAYRKQALPSPLALDGNIDDMKHYENDYAVIRLSSPLNLPYIAMYAASDEELTSTTAGITGYPSDQAFGTMWSASGNVSVEDFGLLGYKIDTYKGESGASLMMSFEDPSGLVSAGIHVAGSREHNSNFAVRLTHERITHIERWIDSE